MRGAMVSFVGAETLHPPHLTSPPWAGGRDDLWVVPFPDNIPSPPSRGGGLGWGGCGLSTPHTTSFYPKSHP